MRITRRVSLALLVLVGGFYLVTAVRAQQRAPTDDEVNAIAKKLYCPVCPNTPLDICETQACKDWRVQIKEQLADGWSEEQVVDYFVVQYGERVLAEPPRRGFSVLVWILPVVVTVLGLFLTGQTLRGWQTRRGAQPATAAEEPAVDPATRAQIEKELRDIL
jgi:cytochrome c-type biogenesis protein CcmH